MNKNIVSLNNHAYQLLGYNVNIIPTLDGDEYYSIFNDIYICIHTKHIGYEVYEDEIINITINPKKKQNLIMFYKHLKCAFNISCIVHSITLSVKLYHGYKCVVNIGIIDDNNMHHILLELVGQEDISDIEGFIDYYIGTDVKEYTYYAIRI